MENTQEILAKLVSKNSEFLIIKHQYVIGRGSINRNDLITSNVDSNIKKFNINSITSIFILKTRYRKYKDSIAHR